jgi:hypothetical protein
MMAKSAKRAAETLDLGHRGLLRHAPAQLHPTAGHGRVAQVGQPPAASFSSELRGAVPTLARLSGLMCLCCGQRCSAAPASHSQADAVQFGLAQESGCHWQQLGFLAGDVLLVHLHERLHVVAEY